MAVTESVRQPKPSAAEQRKLAWKKKNDAGPHRATLPSGMEVTFVIPDSSQLIRADMLPERLAEIAIMAAAYPDGVEGYVQDLGFAAMRGDNVEDKSRLKDALSHGLALRDWLVSKMLVDPPVSVEEVAAGDFPAADIEMLIEFAERRRNQDANGVRLPIVILEQQQPFLVVAPSDEGDIPGGEDADPADEPAGRDSDG